MKNKTPLVSVAIIAYNSSATINDTLNSIYNQAYQNIELVISDDNSKDDTIAICHEWIEKFKDRFVHAEIITSDRNTGVSANCNRAENACHGEWIKLIAGDDMLMPDCIQTYMDYVAEHPDAIYVFAKMEPFGASPERIQIVKENFDSSFFALTPEQQYDRLIRIGNCVPAPTAFFNREKKQALNIPHDERIPLMEDWPMWLNLLKAGVKFHFIDKYTVRYRLSESALSTNGSFSPKFRRSIELFYIYYQFRYLFKHGDKKDAVLRLLRAEKYLHNDGLFWRILLHSYKLIFNIK